MITGPVTTAPLTRFDLPDELSAAEPPEARGLARDDVRLLVAGGEGAVQHGHFRDLPRFLRPGDLLVVNTSATEPAAVDGQLGEQRRPVVVHVAAPLEDGTWVIELRSAPDAARPLLDARVGERVELPGGGRLRLVAPVTDGRLWRATVLTSARGAGGGLPELLSAYGRPVRYRYVRGAWPLDAYQTVFAAEPGSAEMPSAGRPFTDRLVTRLVSAGVRIAPLVLHTGLSSLEAHEPPQPERFRVPWATAALVEATRRSGSRVIAVGTTVVRALESAALPDGTITAAEGWTDLVLGPDHPAHVVDGLITGLHAPDASHLLLLEAVANAEVVQRAYDAALERRYLWHEFGDACLLLR